MEKRLDIVIEDEYQGYGAGPGGWGISRAGVAGDPDKLCAALRLIDYAYGDEGVILMSYGPDAFIKTNGDGRYATFSFNGAEMPELEESFSLRGGGENLLVDAIVNGSGVAGTNAAERFAAEVRDQMGGDHYLEVKRNAWRRLLACYS